MGRTDTNKVARWILSGKQNERVETCVKAAMAGMDRATLHRLVSQQITLAAAEALQA